MSIDNDFLSTAALMFKNMESASAQHIPRNYKLADWMCERLIKSINDFEADIPDDMQAGGKLVSFHDGVFSIDDVGYWNPDIIWFYGTRPDGSKVKLVQHTSQLNLLLVAVPRQDTSKPRRKIGFERDTPEEK